MAGGAEATGPLGFNGQWYAGIDAGYIEAKFTPAYTFLGEVRAPSQFKDLADGTEVGLVAGYRPSTDDRLSVALQGAFSANDAEWSMDNSSAPEHIEYSIPCAYRFSVLPTLKLVHGVSFLTEMGIGQGYVKQDKTSPSATRSIYERDEWTLAYTWGAGLLARLSDRLNISVQYRRSQYGDYRISTRLGDGTPWELIQDNPVTDSYTLGLTYGF